MYNHTQWHDDVNDESTGELIQPGTDQSAANFNNMENGITDASTAAAILLIAHGLLEQQTATEKHTLSMTNSASYPFNSSVQTVSLATTRNSTDYTVEAEVLEHDGNVGDVRIYAKQLNGFKVMYEGSAESATIILKVKGGM